MPPDDSCLKILFGNHHISLKCHNFLDSSVRFLNCFVLYQSIFAMTPILLLCEATNGFLCELIFTNNDKLFFCEAQEIYRFYLKILNCDVFL